ncbi:hypothetical protein GS682_18695 [Nostoc sp. B(2019)]|nr:hypothetical protein [Nostoc sp. B(2019)]
MTNLLFLPKISMNIKQKKKKLFTVIKVISIFFIASAIAWEVGNIYATLTNQKLPNNLNFIFWIERFALVAHLIEGIAAALYAPSKRKDSMQYGTYTFFVGTIGLLELFEEKNSNLIDNQ